MGDKKAARIRERICIEKVDKESDPPRVVREYIENGVVKHVCGDDCPLGPDHAWPEEGA